MSEGTIVVIVAVWIVAHLLAFLFGAAEQEDYPFLLPATIYKNCSVNWFGAILLYILYCLTTPIWAAITLFIYLCTIGSD